MTDRLQCGVGFFSSEDTPAVVMWDLNARDAGKTRTFFRDVFGWQVSDPGEAPVHLATVEGHSRGTSGVIGQAPSPGDDDHGIRHEGLIVYIKVHDVAATLATVAAAGGRAIWGPQEVAPGFVLAQFEDPEGNRFGLST